MKIFKIFKRENKNRQNPAEDLQPVQTVRATSIKPKVKLATLLAAFACCAAALIMGISGLAGSAVQAADASTTSSNLIVLDNGSYSAQGTTFYKNGLKALYRQITNDDNCQTYSAFSTKLSSHTREIGGGTYGFYSSYDYRVNHSDNNLRIKIGGFDWLLGCVSRASRTTDGTYGDGSRIILTLMLADTSSGSSEYYLNYADNNKTNKSATTVPYPCNMYTISKAHSLVADSYYLANSSGTSVTAYTGTKSASYPMRYFSNTYRNFLVQPKYVGWQADEDTVVLNGTGSNTKAKVNDAYVKPSAHVHAENTAYYIYNRDKYSDWKNDYMWLPSLSEIGQSADATHASSTYKYSLSIFQTNKNFRAASNTYFTRTCSQGDSANLFSYYKSEGTSRSYADCYSSSRTTKFYIRPCIHLDLYALDQKTSGVSTSNVSPSWSASVGSTLNGAYIYSATEAYASYTGTGVYPTIYSNDAASVSRFNYSDTMGSSVTSSKPYYYPYTYCVNNSSAHNYRWRYTAYSQSSSGYYFQDGSSAYPFHIKMYRAVLTLGFDKTTFTYNGSAQAPSITSISAKSAAASKVNNTVGTSYLPTSSNFTIAYYGTTATGATYPTGGGTTSTKPTAAGTYKMRVTLTNGSGATQATYWKSYFTRNFTLDEAYADPTAYTASANTWRREYDFVINYGNITSYTVNALSGTYNGAAQSLITTATATTTTTSTVQYSTTSSTSGFSTTMPTRTNAGSYSVWVKITAPYYNDLVVAKTASIGKKDISSGVTWSTISTYTYSGGENKPQPYVTKVGSNSASSSTSDFSYTYPDGNVNAGSRRISIAANSNSTNYKGSATLYFTINKASVTPHTWYSSQGAGVTRDDSTHCTATYTGLQSYVETQSSSAKTDANIDWTFSSTELVWQTTRGDRINFTNAGSYTFTQTLKDSSNYQWSDASSNSSATRVLYLTVNKKDISSGVTWTSIGPYEFDDGDWEPTPTITAIGSTSVTTEVGYFNYSYANNYNVGTATVTITAKSDTRNYTGTASRTFTITQQTIEAVYWLDSQNAGITKNGKTLNCTFNNTKQEFMAYEWNDAPAPSNSSGNWDGNSSQWDSDDEIRRMYATNAGTYTVTWKLSSPGNQIWSDGTTADIVLTVVMAKANVNHGTAYNVNTYTGEPIPMQLSTYTTATTVQNAPAINDLLYVYQYVNQTVNDGTTYNSSTAPTKAGTYGARVTVKPEYSNNYSCSLYWNYTINRATATVTWTKYKMEPDGTLKFPTFAVSTSTSVVQSARPTNSNFTFTGHQSEPGEWTATATLAQAYAYNFQLSGSSCSSISNTDYANTFCTRVFIIGEFKLEKPYLMDVSGDVDMDDELNATATYINALHTLYIYETGSAPSPDFDFDEEENEWGGTQRTISVRNAGTYIIVYSLDDPEVESWEDGTKDDIIITLIVYKNEIDEVVFDKDGDGYSYDGTRQGPTVDYYNTVTQLSDDPDIEDILVVTFVGVNGTTYNSTLMPVDAGQYRIVCTLNEDYADNFEDLNYFTNFRIEQCALEYEALDWSRINSYTYDGTEKTPQPLVTAIDGNTVSTNAAMFKFTYTDNKNAGTAKVKISALDTTVNYCGEKEIEFTISKALITGVSWDKQVFTYDGNEHCPALISLTTQTTVADDAKPLTMFTVTGGKVNAGNYVATATLKPEYAINFTTSASDVNATTVERSYRIDKAYLILTFDNTSFTYNGLAQKPDFTVSTNSGLSVKNDLNVDILSRGESHLINGQAIDAGDYRIHVAMTGELGKNHVKQLNGVAAEDGNWTADFTIAVCELRVNWSDTQFTYNGEKQGTKVISFENAPAKGADPSDGMTLTYFQNGIELTGTPVHAGTYSVRVYINNANYLLLNNSNQRTSSATQNFTIAPVSYAAKGGALNWTNREGLVFNGLPQGATLVGNHKGVFSADSNRNLQLSVTYAQVLEAGVTGNFTDRKFTNAGTYVARVTESYGDYLFDDIQFVIAKRQVTVLWHGDNLSRKDGDTFKWLYDGDKHAPTYTVVFAGDDTVYRDDEAVTELEITYGSLTTTGILTLNAELVDNAYNANFEITAESKTQKIEVELFRVNAVEWYENGSNTPMSEQEIAGLHYETTKVYGVNGPKLVAKGVTTYVTDANGLVTRRIPLNVTYPSYDEGYWEASDTAYKAIANFSNADRNSCEFIDGVLKDDEGVKRVFITFMIAPSRADLEKITISWFIESDGEEIDINDIGEFDIYEGYGWKDGVFTFMYNGKEQYPQPKAYGEYNNRIYVSVGEGGKHKNAGTGYVVYVMPASGYEIVGGDIEFIYNIIPREIVVEWEGESTYVFGDDPLAHLDAVVDDELSTNWLVEGDELLVSIDGLNAGTHVATATVYTEGAVNGNYVLTNFTKTIQITRKPVAIKRIDWSGTLESGAIEETDEDGNTYYVFPNDGTAHVPTAQLIVTVGDEEKTIKLFVMGAQSKAGVYTAYAILDYTDSYNSNIMLVASENASELKEMVASQKFEIAQVTIKTIIWSVEEDGEGATKFEYGYDGAAHAPFAVGVTEKGMRVKLNVWGAQIDAGSYVARVTDEYDYAEGANTTAEFKIVPKTVTVEWLGKDADGIIRFTYDGTEKRPSVNVSGGMKESDYYVSGFVNAGEYVATIVSTNPNYTFEGGESSQANSCAFVIDRREITVSWTGVGNYTPSGATAGVMYWRYNGTERGPVASGLFGSVNFGEDAKNRIIVSGRESNVGSYTATATLDYSVEANANFTLVNTTKRFEITPFEIRVIWTGNEKADGDFEWEYDGEPHYPTAKYKLWNSDEWVYPDKINGAKTTVGEYIASITLPENCSFEKIGGKSCGEQAFSITKLKVTKINWFASAEANAENITDRTDFTFEYTGLSQLPVARVDGTGAELVVTGARINAGTGYIATAALRDAGNYELGANVNSSFTFGIAAKKVLIHWVDNSDKGAFTWTYTGNLVCPEAEFTDVDGNLVPITITGGRITVGTYTATAHDTFLNYDFSDEAGNLTSHTFNIEGLSLGDDFKWLANGGAFTPAAEGGFDTYTFGYDGNVHQPIASCVKNGRKIQFAYTIVLNHRYVDAVVNAGTYTVTVQSSDSNYTIPVDTVTVVITPKAVSAVWGATQLEYNGGVQTPKAHYVDVHGQSVALAVVSDKPVALGSGTATADFAETDNRYGNYILIGNPVIGFNIEAKTTGTFKWDWLTGKFVVVTDGAADAAVSDYFAAENEALLPSKQTLSTDDRRQA